MSRNSSESGKDFLIKNMEIIKERLNRRKGQRLMAEIPLTFKLSGRESVYEGKTINISSYGMAFTTGTVIYTGEKLLFNFKLNQENVVLPGQVTRIAGKEISVEFSLSDEERHRFIKLFNQEIISDKSSIHISLMDIKKRLE